LSQPTARAGRGEKIGERTIKPGRNDLPAGNKRGQPRSPKPGNGGIAGKTGVVSTKKGRETSCTQKTKKAGDGGTKKFVGSTHPPTPEGKRTTDSCGKRRGGGNQQQHIIAGKTRATLGSWGGGGGGRTPL